MESNEEEAYDEGDEAWGAPRPAAMSSWLSLRACEENCRVITNCFAWAFPSLLACLYASSMESDSSSPSDSAP